MLDEPSIGLHQRDNRRLIETLETLCDLGNTLVVVEHDEETIESADWIVDIGPRAGEGGGEVIHSGSVADLAASRAPSRPIISQVSREIPTPTKRRKIDRSACWRSWEPARTTSGCQRPDIPLGVLTAVTGVSGSGKSTLVNDILYNVLASRLNGARTVAGHHTSVTGLEHLDKVVHVDQAPIGRTPRSNPATYTGVFDKIRNLFAETPEAKVRGYLAGRFSFNVKGGRCEACSGDGTLKIEMNFLPDVYVECETCHGKRYNRDTLQVHYKGKNIAEVLEMPISEAAEFFEPITSIHRYMRTLVDVGLGYVRLGQAATTLSGGEAQRVKLATELQKRSNGRSIYVLDEPTTGLHFEDVRKLLEVLGRPRRQGQLVHRDRAQPRRDQVGRLDRRSRPGGRVGRWRDRRDRHAGGRRPLRGEPHGRVPARDARDAPSVRAPRRRARRRRRRARGRAQTARVRRRGGGARRAA